MSQAPWHSLNLGDHVGDDPDAVAENRPRLRALAHLPAAPHYLTQVHGVDVVVLEDAAPTSLRGDAVYTRRPGEVCVVMTADCLPVLFCNRAGREVPRRMPVGGDYAPACWSRRRRRFRRRARTYSPGWVRPLGQRRLRWALRLKTPLPVTTPRPPARSSRGAKNIWPISINWRVYV